jgi:uncharacterized membrane protein
MQDKRTTNRSKDVALVAIVAALYAADVVFFAPISFSPIIQVRVADILLPLSILFGLPAVAGLGIGVLVGNFFASPFGGIDIVGGTIANIIAALLAWVIGRRAFRGAWVTAIVAEILVITFIVGSYLTLFVNVPIWLNWLGVMVGEVVAVGFGGYALLKAIDRVMGKALR